MRETVRFLLGDAPHEIGAVDPTMTVLEWLRLVERRMGTKEGCAEGDCGACTVVLGRPHGGGMRYEPVNACIRFLPTLDGCQLLTVEDLKDGGALHPVQQALVAHHGSQCGYCTPGIVMALFALWKSGRAPDAATVDDALAGNLCRCTGYGSIAAAAMALGQLESRGDRFSFREAETVAALTALADGETIAVEHEGRRFLAPASEEAAVALLAEHPGATPLAGATDVGLWVTKQHRRLDTVLWLGRVRELQAICETADGIELGAGVTYRDAAPVLARHWPAMGEVVRRLGAAQVRACGTVGGNIANGSPIGDSPPLLIAAGAEIELRSMAGTRTLSLEDFFIAYGRQDRRPDELLTRIKIARPGPGTLYKAYKISKRFDQDISAVCAGFRIDLDGDRVRAARLAFGGMAATPKRAAAAEAALVGRPWRRETVEGASVALGDDFRPIDDMRASADYRLRVARNLLLKAWLESDAGASIGVLRPREPAFA